MRQTEDKIYGSEDSFQSDCYLWFHNTYPQYRGRLCYNLNNSRNKVRGMMDKSMGLQPGRSDMVLYHNSHAYMIELKLPGGTQSKEQKKWECTIKNAGFDYVIIRSLEEFQKYLQGILGN